MRSLVLPLTVIAGTLVGCGKNPKPEAAPAPTQAGPPPPPPPSAGPPPRTTAPAGPTCAQVILSMSNAIGEMVHFDTDRYDIRAGDAAILDRKLDILRGHPGVRVRITGHADERYTDEYNFVLGTRRAEAAKDYLVRRGVDGARLETASMGETQPIDPASNEEAWAKNRRDEFLVTVGRETLASHVSGCQ